MPYLGNGLIGAFSAVAYQDLTGGSGTSFTLNHTVANANEIEVFCKQCAARAKCCLYRCGYRFDNDRHYCIK